MQNKLEEIKVHLKKLEKEGEDYKSSNWGREKFERVLDYFYSFLDPNKKYNVLDIGIGSGTLTSYLSENKNFKIIGLDLVRDVLEKVTKKRTNVPLVHGDIEDMPFKDESFDIVVHNQTLHHFPRREKALQEIKRVLKKDGLLLSIETNGWNPYVVYGHKAPWKKWKRFISSNQKVFGVLKFKKELSSAGFAVKDYKMINYGMNFLERAFGKIPILKLIFAGSMVVVSGKN